MNGVHGVNVGQGGQIQQPGEIAPGPGQPPPPPDQGLNPVQVLGGGGQVFPEGQVQALGGLNPQLVEPPLQPQAPPVMTVIQGEGLGLGSQMPLEGVGGLNPQQVVQNKVNEGRELLRNILHGDPPPATPENTAKLMWFLQALGSSKASLSSGDGEALAMYKEGALMLEDPDGRLEAWLNGGDSYSRSSSHMNSYQNVGDQFSPRGVDVRGVETPHDRRTILFQRLPRENEAPEGAPNTGNKRMLYIKMEPHGCRGLSFKGHHQGFFGKVKNFFNNIGDFLGHAFGFIQSQRQQHGLAGIAGQDNRERIPSGVKAQYKAIMEAHPQFAETLGRNNPLDDSRGFRQMKLNLEAAIQAGMPNPPDGPAALLLAEINQRDHLDLRIGNEVILTTDELPQEL